MKISGFTFGKNTVKLYYPIREAIESILPIVDEFVIALGKGDEDDTTLSEIERINSDKIRIIHTEWDTKAYPDGTENAHQTDIAMKACTGDWLFYLQADEVVHEKYLDTIRNRCRELLDNHEIEGLIFRYKHFFGDYWHFNDKHGWYPYEIRIVRNLPDIHSYQSAQSFRRIPDFDGKSYRKKEGSHKLQVAKVDAEIYHYGWVRPPALMQKKTIALETIHKGADATIKRYTEGPAYFDYGPLRSLLTFKDSHPKVMQEMISRFNWKEQLNYKDFYVPDRRLFKHEKPKYKLLNILERTIGRQLFTHKNWIEKKI
ncbi:MAG: hypothetical protein WD077_06115 [Bacteroidia bacterium]